MILSIITINLNNASGLEKTLESVLSQKCREYELIVVDGASSDGSVEVIKRFSEHIGNQMKWISEPDNGIYNAMNKGIKMSTGTYLEFLNSGDYLTSDNVIEEMCNSLKSNNYPSILYGNMMKKNADGSIMRDRCFYGKDITFLDFFCGTLNHSSAYIHRDLFAKYGKYDESLKIVSDWKWYMKAIVFEGEKPQYTDIDVSIFDMTGISETNKDLDKAERRRVLEEFVPSLILSDYDRWAFPISQMMRLERHPWAYRLVWFIERCLFKIEKRRG